MAVTIDNYRIIPYSQKSDLPKVIFGGTWGIEITLPTAHENGDGYILALDYERVVYPLARPVCAYSNSFTLDGDALTMGVALDTLRLAKWVSSIRKPTPICVQIVRVRGEAYETLLLDEILALPSVIDGDAYADPHSPIMDTLAGYVGDGSTTIRQGGVVKGVITANQKTNNVIDLDAGGGGGGSVEQATAAEIDARESTNHAITPNNLDYAGRSVLPNITTIPAATTSYALLDATATTNNHSWQYQHAPTAASTYTLPAVTDTAVAHYIKLTIDFTTVQTYAFEDAQGNALAPLFTPTISAGDVYEFDCEYSAAKAQWLIWPHKQGAVSDDYVMQSEVGAANGVAGLNENGKVHVTNLPYASTAAVGAIRLGTSLTINSANGVANVIEPTNNNIDSRARRIFLDCEGLNYAVTAALTDANKISLTDAQKASAQDTIGAYGTLHLDAAPTTSTVGAFGQRAIVDSTGKEYTCTAVTVSSTDPQNPVTTYTWQEDLPQANYNHGGIVLRLDVNNGIFNSGQWTVLATASEAEVDSRSTHRKAIVPSGLEYAVRSVLPNVTEIPAATSAYTLTAQDATTNNHCYCYEHAPESAPTYTLPAVSGNAVKREIILTVRFSSSVLTYAFEDSAGNALTPLPLAGTIADGSVVCFRCTWEALLGQWVIMPVMLGTYTAPEP